MYLNYVITFYRILKYKITKKLLKDDPKTNLHELLNQTQL